MLDFCNIKYNIIQNKQKKQIMKTTATYQGTTKEEIQSKIIYCENVLKNNELEVFESREYNSLIKEYKEQISEIEKSQLILNEY